MCQAKELVEVKDHRLVEAHFYWMSRDPMEFVFGWHILSLELNCAKLL